MARILAAIVLAIAGSIPLSAGALGLGEIDLKSALNQPFRAEIPVASEAPGDVDALRVEIASVDTFRQFGLDRAAFLSDFQFSVVGSSNGAGGMAVQITSEQPVVEPFVTLLLEVSWPQGRLLREYTVLLDPPVFATESIEAAVAAPTAGPSIPTQTPREEIVPVKSTGATATRVAEPVAEPAGVANPGGAYGPVKRNDTLWTIAGRLVADSTSLSRNQMMLAIYQANPEAFTGNINRLKAGMILRIPSADEVVLGSRDATAEVRRQNEEWRGASTRSDEPQGGRLRLVPPPERDTEGAVPGVQAGAGEDRPAAGAADRDALQGRVSELESQLAESRRQLQVRDRELEALQRQLAEIASQPEAVPVIGAPEPEPELAAEGQPGGDVEIPAAVETAEEPESAAAEQAVAPAPVDVTPVQVERDDESFLGALFTNPLVYITLAIVLLLAWLFARNRSKTADQGTGRWEALEDDELDEEEHEATTRLRAQPSQDETFVVEESTPGEATGDGSVAPFTDVSSEDWGGLIEESETPLERTISTDSAVNLDQADPIAEADFHMAYGLYDQAADLLTRAVESEPERKDLRMKLLEVYFIWENQDGFLQEAKALQQHIDGAADSDWNKVLIMGKQICPDEALFAGEATPVSLPDSVDLEFGEGGGSDDAIDIAFDDDSASSVDLEFDEVAAGLDLDLTRDDLPRDDDHADKSDGFDLEIDDEDEATLIVGNDDLEMSGHAPTMETPTIESPAVDGESTMETPTIESPAVDGESTMETPTIESPAMDGESTMETPTIESPVGEWGDDDAGAGSEQTAELELGDLGLDLSGLDDDDALGADSGASNAESDAAGEDSGFAADTLEFNAPGDETQQQPVTSLDRVPGDVSALDELADDIDSTAEMRNLDEPQSGDTVEQPTVGGQDTAEQPSLAAAAEDDVVHDIGEPVIDDDLTAEVEETGSGIESATMTEVGTKLDLARAYIDMGDPDGARSILNEVLEEAEAGQRQEAQQLLDDLDED